MVFNLRCLTWTNTFCFGVDFYTTVKITLNVAAFFSLCLPHKLSVCLPAGVLMLYNQNMKLPGLNVFHSFGHPLLSAVTSFYSLNDTI